MVRRAYPSVIPEGAERLSGIHAIDVCVQENVDSGLATSSRPGMTTERLQ
jgi:hypothetical protein